MRKAYAAFWVDVASVAPRLVRRFSIQGGSTTARAADDDAWGAHLPCFASRPPLGQNIYGVVMDVYIIQCEKKACFIVEK